MLNTTPNTLSSQSPHLASSPDEVLPLHQPKLSPLFRLQEFDRGHSLYALATAVLDQHTIEQSPLKHSLDLDAWAETLTQDVLNAND